jgi:hypothetical protein
VFLKSYFDESYDDALLCVAGYSFTSANARHLDEDWRKMLARHARLPFFRMSACNANQYPFDSFSKQECIDVASEAIGLINKYAGFGYAVTVDQKLFHKVIGRNGFVSSPYEFCSWVCLSAVKMEFGKLFPESNMRFFFEAGFRHQNLANKMMIRIFKSPQLREQYRYKSHTFVDKKDSRPTQAADLLAWQWYKDSIRRRNGIFKPRGDLFALTRGTKHYVLHADSDKLAALVELLNGLASLALSDAEAHLLSKRLFGL